MKHKVLLFLLFFVGMNLCAFSQDTLYTSTVTKKGMVKSHKQQVANINSKSYKKPRYRDTRLGSSSPEYNTYKKNKNGAGAVTTSPK